MSDAQVLRSRVAAVERLAALFKVERFVYLGVTGVSFLLLLAVAGRMLYQGSAQAAEWMLLFGSSGLITITASRVLQMWSQALRLLAAEPIDGAGGKQ
jgi:hypothetical protein